MKITKAFFSFFHKQTYLPDTFGILINPLFISRFFLLKKLKRYFSLLKGNLLDFGCGTSPYRLLIPVDNYFRVDFEQTFQQRDLKNLNEFFLRWQKNSFQ